jgi:hypothetical protein
LIKHRLFCVSHRAAYFAGSSGGVRMIYIFFNNSNNFFDDIYEESQEHNKFNEMLLKFSSEFYHRFTFITIEEEYRKIIILSVFVWAANYVYHPEGRM